MNEHKPDWGWIGGGAIMLLLGRHFALEGVAGVRLSPADLFQRPIMDESLAGVCRGRLVSWFGTVLNHQGSFDKDRKMSGTSWSYDIDSSSQTMQPTATRPKH